MPTDVKINFRISGAEDVQRAFATISGQAQRMAREGVRQQQAAGQARVAAAKRTSAQLLSEAEAQAKAEIAIIQRKNREAVNAARMQVAAERELAAAKAQAAAKEKADRAAARADARAAAQATRNEAKAVAAAAREHAAAAANRRKTAGEIAGGIGAGAKAGAALVVGAAGVSAAGAVRSQLALDERAALLANASGKSRSDFDSVKQAKSLSNLTGVGAEEVMGGFEKLSGKAGGGGLVEFTGQFEALAKIARGAGVSMTDLGDTLGTLYNRGVRSKDVVQVVEALVQQGKDGAVEFNQLATLLDASSGALGRFKMDDATRVMSAGGLSQFARTFGKKSAEEATNAVEDLARDLGGKADDIQKLTGGTLTKTHVKGKKTMKMVGGKMVETTVGDSTIDSYAGGVEVGTDTSRAQLRDINTLLPDIIEGVVKTGNEGKLMGAGGIFTGNATAIAGPLLQAFKQGISKNKEGRYELTGEGQRSDVTGRAAVEAMLKQFQAAEVAPGSSGKAFDAVMATSQAKMNVQIETLKNSLGEKLAPMVAKVVENPKTAAAGVVAGGAALGAANVGLGKVTEMALDKFFPKTVGSMTVTAASVVVGGPGGAAAGAASAASAAGGTGASAVGAAAGGVSKLGMAAQAAGVFIGAGLATAGVLEYADSGTQERRKAAQNPINESIGLAFKIRRGEGTDEDRAKAQALLGQLNKAKEESTWFDRATGDKTGERAGAAAAQLQEALSATPLKLDPSSTVQLAAGTNLTVTVANIGDLNAQQPKIQAPLPHAHRPTDRPLGPRRPGEDASSVVARHRVRDRVHGLRLQPGARAAPLPGQGRGLHRIDRAQPLVVQVHGPLPQRHRHQGSAARVPRPVAEVHRRVRRPHRGQARPPGARYHHGQVRQLQHGLGRRAPRRRRRAGRVRRGDRRGLGARRAAGADEPHGQLLRRGPRP